MAPVGVEEVVGPLAVAEVVPHDAVQDGLGHPVGPGQEREVVHELSLTVSQGRKHHAACSS